MESFNFHFSYEKMFFWVDFQQGLLVAQNNVSIVC